MQDGEGIDASARGHTPVSIDLNAVTRKRIGQISQDRRDSADRTRDRKNSIFKATSKWTDPIPDSEKGKKKKLTRKSLEPAGDCDSTEYSTIPGDADSPAEQQPVTKSLSKKALRRKSERAAAAAAAAEEARPISRRSRSKSPHGLKNRRLSKGGSVERPESSRVGRKTVSSPSRTSKKKLANSSMRQTRTIDAVAPKSRRESSQGPVKKKSIRGRRSKSTDNSSLAEDAPQSSKSRSSSAGPLKKRSSSPGKLKKRMNSSGRLKANLGAKSPGAHVSKPGDNRGMLGAMLGQVTGKPKKKEARSVVSAPAEAAEVMRRSRRSNTKASFREIAKRRRARSNDLENSLVEENKTKPRRVKSADDYDNPAADPNWRDKKTPKKKSSRQSQSTEVTHQGDSSSTEHDPRAPRGKEGRRAALLGMKQQQSGKETKAGGEPMRAQSMMMHRTNTRRGGKTNSLVNLVEYSEDEIHSTSYFASNHVLVNRERMKRGLRPLTRNIAMDELARKNAKLMADTKGTAPLKVTYVGNVLRGESIRAVHRATMSHREGRERANLLNPYFQDFGVGTSKGDDGMLYVCQLFSERLELTCTSFEA